MHKSAVKILGVLHVALDVGMSSRFSIPCIQRIETQVDTRAPIRRIGVHIGQVIDTTDSDFDVVTKSGSWVLVDFWAPWCGPCKMIAPVLSQLRPRET